MSETNGSSLAVIEQPKEYQLAPANRGMLTAYVEEATAMVGAVRDLASRVLREGVDYGQIPGTGKDAKPTLLKPGAETLLAAFRLGTGVIEIQEKTIQHDIPGHVEYTVMVPIVNRATGEIVGSGVGSCSTMETKYRYRQGERKCPKCGKAAIIKGKAEFGGGWLCFDKKGGCKAKFNDGDSSIEGQQVGRVENQDPADCHNTCLKMAKKRALIDAALTTCAASGVFTQDLDEMEEYQQQGQQSTYNPNTGQRNQGQQQAARHAPAQDQHGGGQQQRPALPVGQRFRAALSKGQAGAHDGKPCIAWVAQNTQNREAYSKVVCFDLQRAQEVLGATPAQYVGDALIELAIATAQDGTRFYNITFIGRVQ